MKNNKIIFLDTSVTHLKFVVREDADSLVIAVNSDSGGIVEVWELREKSQPVHKLFQPKTLEPFKTIVVCVLQFKILIVFHTTNLNNFNLMIYIFNIYL